MKGTQPKADDKPLTITRAANQTRGRSPETTENGPMPAPAIRTIVPETVDGLDAPPDGIATCHCGEC